jgi:hypothetical protein
MTQISAAKRRPLTNSFASPVSFTVGTTVFPSFAPRAAARFVTQGRDRQALGVPHFSCEAAFLRDAMAAHAAQVGQRRRADPTLFGTAARQRDSGGKATCILRFLGDVFLSLP